MLARDLDPPEPWPDAYDPYKDEEGDYMPCEERAGMLEFISHVRRLEQFTKESHDEYHDYS